MSGIDQIQAQNIPLNLAVDPDDMEGTLEVLVQQFKQTLTRINELDLRIRKLEQRFK